MAAKTDEQGVTLAAPSFASAPSSARRITLASRLQTVAPPIVAFGLLIGAWEVFVRWQQIPVYLLPPPSTVMTVAFARWGDLLTSVSTTFTAALAGLGMSIIVGITAALVMSQNKLLERSLYPYAVTLQTIPIIAVAPLIIIWFGAGTPAVIIIAFLISLFPMISNTAAGLTSTDHNLISMFELYNANWWQRIVKLKLPFALPYIMTGLRTSSGLAIIGAIVGEFVGGIGGQRGGLGYVLTAAAIRLDMPYLFAAAFASALLGISIFMVVSLIQKLLLGHWHESAIAREG